MNDRVELFRSRRPLLRMLSFRSLHASPERALQAPAAAKEPARQRGGGWSWLRRRALPVLILLLLVSSSGHTFA